MSNVQTKKMAEMIDDNTNKIIFTAVNILLSEHLYSTCLQYGENKNIRQKIIRQYKNKN